VLNKEIPFLRIGLPLCLGIISGLYIHQRIYLCIILIIICLAGFILSLFFNLRPTNYIYGAVLPIALYTCGLILMTNEKNNISELKSKETVFKATLTDYPEEKQNTFMLTLKLSGFVSGDSIFRIRGSMILYHKKDSLAGSLKPGDIILFRCTPEEITNKGNPYEFNYRFYMESNGIRYCAFTDKKDIITSHPPYYRRLRYQALIVREKIIRMYEERGITGERLALVSAITFGQKNHLDPEQKQNFIKAGVMHIMAVSGLHAVILSLFIFNLLFFLKRRLNVLRIIITILVLWAFAFVTGLTPSVLRATLMFSFLQAGNLMKRRVNPINSVLASAFVLILIRPSVIFEAGFLLSYAAVLYIIGFYQDLYLKVQLRNWFPDKIWQSIAITLVAQAGTLPLTIMLFNRFPTYFIITNTIIVPLSSFLIIIGCLVPLTFPIVPVSQFLATVLDKLTGLTELLTEKSASLPFSTIDNLGITSIECILLTAAVSLLLFFVLKKQSINIKYPVAAFLLFVVAVTIKDIAIRKNNELIVYNTPGYSTIGIKTGRLLNLFNEQIIIPPEVVRHSAVLGLRIEEKPSYKTRWLIRAGNENILITDSLSSSCIRNNTVTIIILTGDKPFIEKNISLRNLKAVQIITTEAAASFHLPYPNNLFYSKKIWSVRKSGAYRHTIRA
jgi:competence protein ComEC